ncbi:uncharacterized protein LOC143921011 isoform X2 [Arctopsyche grandis]|uniref:uncharacterized protein LOC143921011 isoform X2 n=1 Tax=Arctopsyche grandis TaxID=121162 RepID=UPI00406D6ACD
MSVVCGPEVCAVVSSYAWGAAPVAAKPLQTVATDTSGAHGEGSGGGASSGTCHQSNLCDAWINAFSWSGAVVLGWYASQVTLLRRKHLNWENPFEKKSLCYDFFFNNSPTLRTKVANSIPYNDDISKQTFSPDVTFNRYPMSPVTISNDEVPNGSAAVKNAENEFKDVLRSIENKLGILAIDNGELQEGLAMLQSSAQRNYAPALFNLAVCYEKGLAVKKDEIMAMELYRAAAVKNHAGAMYNLAVFYGQGRGGLARDMTTAKELMHVAAAQGSEEAVSALKLFEKPKLGSKVDAAKPKLSPTESFLTMIGCDEKAKLNECVLLY